SVPQEALRSFGTGRWSGPTAPAAPGRAAASRAARVAMKIRVRGCIGAEDGSRGRPLRGALLRQHRAEPVEDALEADVEVVLHAVGVVRGAGVEDDASEQREAAAL